MDSNWWRARGFSSKQLELFRKKFIPSSNAAPALVSDYEQSRNVNVFLLGQDAPLFVGKGAALEPPATAPRPLPYEAGLECHRVLKPTIQGGTGNRPRD
jgi:hypothetical protein